MSEPVTRVEELTLAILDGTAEAGAGEELARLVAKDAEAHQMHLSLIELEVALRGRRPQPVAEAVMARIQRERTERAVRGVMSQVSSMTPLARGPRARRVTPNRIARAALRGATAVVAVVGGLLLVDRGLRDEGGPTLPRFDPPPSRPAPPVAARPAATGEPSLEVSGPDPAEVLSHDFEDGALSPVFIDGHLVDEHCAPGSRYCALGTMSPYDASHNTVTIERYKPPVLSYAPNQVLSFDYWVGTDGSALRVQLWVPARKENFAVFLEDLVTERWGHAEIRLGELRSYKNRNRLTSGDAVGNIMITAGRMGGAPFYVDNLRVLAYPPEASLPPTSAAGVVSP
jgi:hypothetical protein